MTKKRNVRGTEMANDEKEREREGEMKKSNTQERRKEID